MAFIKQSLSVMLWGFCRYLTFCLFRFHVVFVLTELSKGVNISGLRGEDTQKPNSGSLCENAGMVCSQFLWIRESYDLSQKAGTGPRAVCDLQEITSH